LQGARFVELPEQLRQRGGEGVVIEEIEAGSRAAANGLRPADVITAVNRRDVADLQALGQRLASPPEQLLLTVVRGRRAVLALIE